MADNTKIGTNPIEVIWSGCKGNYGTGWQVISIILAIAAASIGANLWNGLQGRACNPETAAVDLRDANRTARLLGCGSRSFLEMIAGEGEGDRPAATEAPSAAPSDDVITVPE